VNIIRKKQINIIILLFIVGLIFFMNYGVSGEKKAINVSKSMSLKQVAKKNNIPLKKMLHILSHEDRNVWDFDRNEEIQRLVLTKEQVIYAIEHVWEEDNPRKILIKYMLWVILIGYVLFFILTGKKIKKKRKIIMFLSVIIFGIILGAGPNPMESVVKILKLLNNMEVGIKEIIISVIIFTFFSLLGNKLICGWGCQLGALQESIFNLNWFKKKYKLPFAVSIAVRLVFFILFIVFLFGLGMGIKNFVLYHHLNYFKIFHFSDLAVFTLWTLVIFLGVSFFIFRPFCQLICPFGLYSWILENISLNKIKIDLDKCINCKKCISSCPTEAMKGIYDKKRKYFLPDCWSCGACIEDCPVDAISYLRK
jgi:NAD-dependent dihydropyrimidine dehydrogenase PreA subunit